MILEVEVILSHIIKLKVFIISGCCGSRSHCILSERAIHLLFSNGWVEVVWQEPMKFLVDMLNHAHWLRIVHNVHLKAPSTFLHHFSPKMNFSLHKIFSNVHICKAKPQLYVFLSKKSFVMCLKFIYFSIVGLFLECHNVNMFCILDLEVKVSGLCKWEKKDLIIVYSHASWPCPFLISWNLNLINV